MTESDECLSISNDVTFPEEQQKETSERDWKEERTAALKRKQAETDSVPVPDQAEGENHAKWTKKLTGQSPKPRKKSKHRPALATIIPTSQHQAAKPTPDELEHKERMAHVKTWVKQAHKFQAIKKGPPNIPLEPLPELQIALLDKEIVPEDQNNNGQIAEPDEEIQLGESACTTRVDKGVELIRWPNAENWAKLKYDRAPHLLEFAIPDVPIPGTEEKGPMNYKLRVPIDSWNPISKKPKFSWKSYTPSGKVHCKLERGEIKLATVTPKVLLGPATDPRKNIPAPPPTSDEPRPWPEPKGYPPEKELEKMHEDWSETEEEAEPVPKVKSKVVVVSRPRKRHFERREEKRNEKRKRHSRH